MEEMLDEQRFAEYRVRQLTVKLIVLIKTFWIIV